MRKHLLIAALIAGCGARASQVPAGSSANVATLGSEASPPPAQNQGEAVLAFAVASPNRSEKNRARDQYRHPAETLGFFGVSSKQRVIELWPGGGWYTEILAPILRDEGKLVAVAPTGDYLKPYQDFLAAKPSLYDRVELVEVTPPDKLALGPDASADVVLTFRNLHGWITGGYEPQVHQAIFRVLKPGGVYGVVEHRAKPGTSAAETAKSGYVSEEATIAMVTAAGFVLDASSEINANPKDTKDHPNGVWSLPPSLRGGEVDREKFVAIGESDRMTLRFRKPTQ
jgi:predicted methyltransferase